MDVSALVDRDDVTGRDELLVVPAGEQTGILRRGVVEHHEAGVGVVRGASRYGEDDEDWPHAQHGEIVSRSRIGGQNSSQLGDRDLDRLTAPYLANRDEPQSVAGPLLVDLQPREDRVAQVGAK